MGPYSHFFLAAKLAPSLQPEPRGDYLWGAVTAEQTGIYQRALGEYFRSRSFESALITFQAIGMFQNTRMEKYRRAYQKMQKQGMLNRLLMLGIRNSRLEARVIEHVRGSMGS